jgi:hypothetical protein
MRGARGPSTPVAGVGLTPLPNTLDMRGAFEVITIGRLATPLKLAGGFARFAAFGQGAVALASGTTGVGIKESLTVQTLAFAQGTSHWPDSPQVNEPHLAAW